MRIYITPEEYEIAEANGISKKRVDVRVRKLGWPVKKAITKPTQNRNQKEWVEKAIKNGITPQCYYGRVHKNWSKEEASTIPMMTPQEAGRLGQAAFLRNKTKNEGVSTR